MSFLLAAAAAAAGIACAAPTSDALVGRWESQAISKGGMGTVIDLRADGTYVQATSVLIELRYVTQGGELTLRSKPGGPPSPDTAVRFEVRGNTLNAGIEGGRVVEATRVGPPEAGAPPIVGGWRYRHYTGAISYDRYTSDGRLLMRIPMSSEKACYTVDAGAGRLEIVQGSEVERVSYRLEDDRLELTGEHGPQAFLRAEFGTWYDIDSIDYEPPKDVPERPRKREGKADEKPDGTPDGKSDETPDERPDETPDEELPNP